MEQPPFEQSSEGLLGSHGRPVVQARPDDIDADADAANEDRALEAPRSIAGI